jgi:hypothetical protein
MTRKAQQGQAYVSNNVWKKAIINGERRSFLKE